VAWEQSRQFPGAAPANGSPSMAQHQIERLPHGNSFHHQPPQEAANVNPSKKVDPSMLASSTSMDSESEITPHGNPISIHNDRNPL
jgi:hypothetical protein